MPYVYVCVCVSLTDVTKLYPSTIKKNLFTKKRQIYYVCCIHYLTKSYISKNSSDADQKLAPSTRGFWPEF